jgi:hypothetical protein
MEIMPTTGPHVRYVIFDEKGYWNGQSWGETGVLYYSHEDASKIIRNIQLVEGLGKPSKRYTAMLTVDVIGDVDEGELVKYLVEQARLTLNSPSSNDSTVAIQIDWGTLKEEVNARSSSTSTSS